MEIEIRAQHMWCTLAEKMHRQRHRASSSSEDVGTSMPETLYGIQET